MEQKNFMFTSESVTEGHPDKICDQISDGILDELFKQDPQKANLIYGTGELSPQEFRDLVFYYELALTYVLTRKGSDQVSEAIESRVKREIDEPKKYEVKHDVNIEEDKKHLL